MRHILLMSLHGHVSNLLLNYQSIKEQILPILSIRNVMNLQKSSITIILLKFNDGNNEH